MAMPNSNSVDVPSNKNDPELTYDPINKVVLALVKVTTGEGDKARHDVQTWAYKAGANMWMRMKPSAEPDVAGNRTRNLIFAPELNLAILENCTGRPREQQIWTYRYADIKGKYQPSETRPRKFPPIVEDVVVSVLAKNRVGVTWKPPPPQSRQAITWNARLLKFGPTTNLSDSRDAPLRLFRRRSVPSDASVPSNN